MKVLVLDDDNERLKIFKKKLEKYPHVDLVGTAPDAIKKLKNNDYDYLFLDHDLGGRQMVWNEDNCGMNVVDWIIKNNYHKDVIIYVHSFNLPRGEEMVRRLEDASYDVIHEPGVWELLQ